MQPFTNYMLSSVKIPVTIGPSDCNCRTVNLHYIPKNIDFTVQVKPSISRTTPGWLPPTPGEGEVLPEFRFDVADNSLVVTRMDSNCGWTHDLRIDICIQSNENVYLFNEILPRRGGLVACHVVDRSGGKLFDSRHPEYYRNKGW